MKLEPLTHREEDFLIATSDGFQGLLEPVPWFIISPSNIHQVNKSIVNRAITFLLKDQEFLAEAKIDSSKIVFLLEMAGAWVLWKRGWFMRIQWVLQILSIVFLIKMLFWVFL